MIDTSTHLVSYTYTDDTELAVEVTASNSVAINSIESSYTDLEGQDSVSKTLNFFPVGGHIWEGYSFVKGYTLFEQIYANDVYPLVVTAESSEQYVSAATAARPTQIWIG